MDVTKPYEFIGFGAMDVTKPYEFIGFGGFRQDSGRESFKIRPKAGRRADFEASTDVIAVPKKPGRP